MFFFMGLSKVIINVVVLFVIFGDLVYGFINWLMRFFIDWGNFINEEVVFNIVYSKIRVVVENVFG